MKLETGTCKYHGNTDMLNSKILWLICLIVFVYFAIHYALDQKSEHDETEVMAQNDPDFYMLDADIIQFDATGKRQHLISAEKLNHYPLTDITTLRTPNLTLYADGTGQSPWNITAKHGRILPRAQLEDQIVELWDEVLIMHLNKNNNLVQIQSETLTVLPDKDYAETDQKVYIDNHTGNTVAGGMRAYFGKEEFVFLSNSSQRVHATLLTQFTVNP